MTTHSYSLPFLPATSSSPSRTFEGLFELTRRPSRALNSPHALLPELQRYKDTVSCAERRSQDTVNNNWCKPWLCVCWKCIFLHRSLILKSQQNKIEVVTRPGVDVHALVVVSQAQTHRCAVHHNASSVNQNVQRPCNVTCTNWSKECQSQFHCTYA